MEETRNAGPPAPVNTDPGATRYFPPQDGRPDAPAQSTRPETPRAEQVTYQERPAPTPPAYPATNQTNLPPYSAPANRHERERTILGLILVGGGALFLLQQFSVFSSFGVFIPLLIGSILLYAYFTTRPGYRIGFLIPGAILTGLGVGLVLENLTLLRFWPGGEVIPFTLGLGFCLIWVLERRHWWFLIPGGILIFASLSSLWFFGALWPVGLIALGAYLLYDQSRRRGRV